jgi:predicted nucleic acid-binding protein
LKIYLDVSCLNRPFDDQGQVRIRLESDAITMILERVDRGQWNQVSSAAATIEIDAIKDAERRARVRMLLPEPETIMELSSSTFERTAALVKLGFKPADALHVAAAEELQADVLLSCDDRLCRVAQRHGRKITVRVANPLDWLKEMDDAADA